MTICEVVNCHRLLTPKKEPLNRNAWRIRIKKYPPLHSLRLYSISFVQGNELIPSYWA